MSYDTKCYELAEHFLDDSASVKRVSDLAQGIQDYIEDWLGGEMQQEPDPGSWGEYQHIKGRIR